MRVLQLVVEVPENASLQTLQHLLEKSGFTVRMCDSDGACDEPLPPLTPMEQSVLRTFSQLDTNEEIARQFGVSSSTVRTHVKNVFRKLATKSRGVAVAKALRYGLLSWQEVASPPSGGEKSSQRL